MVQCGGSVMEVTVIRLEVTCDDDDCGVLIVMVWKEVVNGMKCLLPWQ